MTRRSAFVVGVAAGGWDAAPYPGPQIPLSSRPWQREPGRWRRGLRLRPQPLSVLDRIKARREAAKIVDAKSSPACPWGGDRPRPLLLLMPEIMARLLRLLPRGQTLSCIEPILPACPPARRCMGLAAPAWFLLLLHDAKRAEKAGLGRLWSDCPVACLW